MLPCYDSRDIYYTLLLLQVYSYIETLQRTTGEARRKGLVHTITIGFQMCLGWLTLYKQTCAVALKLHLCTAHLYQRIGYISMKGLIQKAGRLLLPVYFEVGFTTLPFLAI